jgi:DNA-3-methyladenine glycosylase II
MSNAKVRYLNNLTQAVMDGNLAIAQLDSMTDEEVIEELITVKGIGRWTAEMFLIFTLAREDIFSFGDLGKKKD